MIPIDGTADPSSLHAIQLGVADQGRVALRTVEWGGVGRRVGWSGVLGRGRGREGGREGDRHLPLISGKINPKGNPIKWR